MYAFVHSRVIASLVMALAFANISLLAQPTLGEKPAFDPLSVFQEHPEINQVEVFSTTDDVNRMHSTITIDRAKQVITMERFGNPEDVPSIVQVYYNERWQKTERTYLLRSQEVVQRETYAYNEENQLRDYTIYRKDPNGKSENDLVVGTRKRYYYEGKESLLVEWEEVYERSDEEGPMIIKTTIAYDNNGRWKTAKVSSLDQVYQTYILAKTYRWKYGENVVEQTLRDAITRRKSKLQQWFDEDGRLIKEEGGIIGHDTRRTFTYNEGLLTEVSREFAISDPEKERQSTYRYSYK